MTEIQQDFADLPLDLPMEAHGIVLRQVDQQTYTNVPHLVTQHSPSGYEWGYGGSGTADLALNILEWRLRREHYQGQTIPCFEGRCYRLAWDLHQASSGRSLPCATGWKPISRSPG